MDPVAVVATALWAMLPAYVPNNVAVVAGGGRPIDGGRTWNGRRLLGDGKTWRGTAAGVLAGVGLAVLANAAHESVGTLVGVGLPTARLKFDPSGEVLLAEMLESTGYDNIDAPILASLYKWQATGPKLEAIDQPFSITIHFTRSGNE